MFHIRRASVEDVPLVLEMILEFAAFEKLREEVTITEAMLERDGFGTQPRFRTLIAEWNHAAAGYAICFPIYSTFQGPALFLEDVYVRPQFRDKGVGKALIGEVAAMALQEGCGALRWEVLQWNQPAIDFYKRLGAIFLDDWKAVRIEGEALRKLAEQSKAQNLDENPIQADQD